MKRKENYKKTNKKGKREHERKGVWQNSENGEDRDSKQETGRKQIMKRNVMKYDVVKICMTEVANKGEEENKLRGKDYD